MGVHSVWGVERPDPTKGMRVRESMGLSLDGGAEGLCKPETRQCARRFGVCVPDWSLATFAGSGNASARPRQRGKLG